MNPNRHHAPAGPRIEVNAIRGEGVTEFLNLMHAEYGESEVTPDLQLITQRLLHKVLHSHQED